MLRLPFRFLSLLVPISPPSYDFNNIEPPGANCFSDQHFVCKRGEVRKCLPLKYKCDGIVHCDEATDELQSVCGNCTSDSLFPCTFHRKSLCLNKVQYQCDGIVNCDGAEDELLSVCANNCSDDTKFTCKMFRYAKV